MARIMTTNKLIDSIKRRAMIPANQVTFEESDFINLLNEEMELGIVPAVLSHHEDYLLAQSTTALATNTSSYSIPYRAVGNKLKDLVYVDSNGNSFEMSRIHVEDVPQYQGEYTSSNILRYFYILNDSVVLVPDITTNISGSLKFTFYQRPNEMVAQTRAGEITAIDTVTGEVTINGYNSNTGVFDSSGTFPTVFTTSETYDFIKANSPHKTLGQDLSISAVDSSTGILTFTASDLPSTLAVGDFVNLEGEAIVPQIPSDMHVVLAHRVAARCLDEIGDIQGLQAANAKLVEMEDRAQHLINDRVESAPIKVVSRYTPLRSGVFRRNRNW